MSLKNDIVSALEKVTAKDATETHAWVKPYEAPAADVHQFLFFLKPEATASYDVRFSKQSPFQSALVLISEHISQINRALRWRLWSSSP